MKVIGGTPERPTFVGASALVSEVIRLARRSGESDAKVLITGESGSGKDLVAREIHATSPRRNRPFIAVNCAGLPDTLLESELFGHTRGSFTGADRDRPGLLQSAHGATCFLDEVGEMSPRMQALLLRFLESGEIQTVGTTHPRTVDVRIIAATNRNLAERVAAGEFRQDLFFRLRVVQIFVPPLRDRRDDIPALVDYFLRSAPRRMTCSDEALRALQRYRWPGNIRELRNVVEQTVWLTAGSEIQVSDLPEPLRSIGSGIVPTQERRHQVADQLFDAVLQGHYSFWDHIRPLFLQRDLTRHDIRELVSRGLNQTKGNYRAVVKLFGMPETDYDRFHNFLAAHSCKVDFRSFRTCNPVPSSRPPAIPKVS
jgi:DNA-binding NtrC family response regulator